MSKPQYDIVMSEQTLEKINEYRNNLISGQEQPGAFLQDKLQGKSVKDLKTNEFIEILLSTKKPVFFAESAIKGGGRDWNNSELKILGDINVTVPVKIHDNGVWAPKFDGKDSSKQYDSPHQGELLFTPGALLKSGSQFSGQTPDFAEVTKDGKIDQAAYNRLVERRLLPLLVYANEQAKIDGKPAVITMPGVGAGVFAGPFAGQMGNHLDQAMQAMLEKHGANLENIAAVHFDPGKECSNQEKNFGNLKYRVRPSLQDSEDGRANATKKQLSTPSELEENSGEFKNCKVYKIVAWDHVSLPGNDFFAGIRHTDDGVAAAATTLMHGINGIEGKYNPKTGQYEHPSGYRNWEDVANKNNVHLLANDNIKIISNDAKSYSLAEFEKKQQDAAKQPGVGVANQTVAAAKIDAIQAASSAQIEKNVAIYPVGGEITKDLRVAIKFSNQSERDKFFDYMAKENKDHNQLFERENHLSDVVYIKASPGAGGIGAYISSGKQSQLSINFGSDEVAKIFHEALNLKKEHGYLRQGRGTFYFDPNLLHPDSTKEVPLITTSNLTSNASFQQSLVQTLAEKTLAQSTPNQTIATPKIDATQTPAPTATQDPNGLQNASQASNAVKISQVKNDDPDITRIALQFQSQRERDKFVAHMGRIAANENVNLGQIFDQSEVFDRSHKLSNTLYINPSDGVVGAYVSGNQQLSINFGNTKVAEEFFAALALKKSQGYVNNNKRTLYFEQSAFPPIPYGDKIIETKFSVADNIGLAPIQPKKEATLDIPNSTTFTPKVDQAPQPIVQKPVIQPPAQDPVVAIPKVGTVPPALDTQGIKPSAAKDVLENNVKIYSAPDVDKNGPRVALEFSNPQERDKFVDHMIRTAAFQEVELIRIFDRNHDGHPNVVYVNSSRFIGDAGTYITPDGKLSVNLGSYSVASKFKSGLGLTGRGDLYKDSNTLYFNKNHLPPTPGSQINIVTTLNYTSDIQPQQAQAHSQKPVSEQVLDKPTIVTPKVETVHPLHVHEPKAPAATIQAAAPFQKVEAVPPAPVVQEPKTPIAVQTVTSQKTDTAPPAPAVQEPKALAPNASQDSIKNSPSKPNILARAYNAIKTFFHNVGARIAGNTGSEETNQTPVKQSHLQTVKAPTKSPSKGKTFTAEEIMSKNPVPISDKALDTKSTSKRAIPKLRDNDHASR